VPMKELKVDQDRILQLMGRHPFTDNFSAEQEAKLATICTLEEFQPNDYFLREDEVCERFFLLIKGLVSVELRLQGGEVLRVQTEGPGGELGWSWLFPPYRGAFDIRAVEPCKAIAVDAAKMRQMMEDDPSFGYRATTEILQTVMTRLFQSRLQLVDIHTMEGER
jgi:CRP/FNR family transcriptional regulator, cyclic AMP receptor protein